MKIYTKTGDKGKTSLFGGTRVNKSHLRIDAYGTIDELNANIGLLKDQVANEFIIKILYEIQDRLFVLGAILATEPEKSGMKLPVLKKEDIRFLEIEIDKMEENLPPLKNFIIPGGHPVVSLTHIARTVCRRAERSMVLLSENSPVDGILLEYVNRLSDFLFVLGRQLAKELNVNEITWHSSE
ncbi:cob(I)yrinic acid a,c-diamide adenosyltransferase [Cyclobacterium sp. 1_MG-2023]|uniref:cob(I)yrinic acid a,c-diamide adenosyltransferase n=1 Tax=Cyclobacterium sp. 1_MG-2023 TaxID=3062681 RepID=UPI0026E1312E|nr:cob(I)yrinic acid a,c-diamide adenosyltransferase [Cyclobacterium sp. 1_MG-2023]MDO6437602.1 cob(I)yrinic acid a,c-diamide adenosyltransferase [Cyclobacterium sp. 1_MG-2023]